MAHFSGFVTFPSREINVSIYNAYVCDHNDACHTPVTCVAFIAMLLSKLVASCWLLGFAFTNQHSSISNQQCPPSVRFCFLSTDSCLLLLSIQQCPLPVGFAAFDQMHWRLAVKALVRSPQPLPDPPRRHQLRQRIAQPAISSNRRRAARARGLPASQPATDAGIALSGEV
jgi:hypothetical protein